MILLKMIKIKKKNMLKRLLISFLLANLLFLSIFAAPAKAQWYNQSFGQWYTQVYDDENPAEIFGERYTAAQVQWVTYGFIALLIHTITERLPINPVNIVNFITTGDISELSSNSTAPQPIAQNKGQSGKHLLKEIFRDKPLSGITYTKEAIKNIKLIPEAKAQTTGFGFQTLGPIRGLWRISRNIAYTLFVLVTIVLSFMIMFRVKISPQAVITVQSALPRIFLALILVTFSYPIAGFLIDIMYVTIGLISLLVGGTGNALDIFNLLTKGLDPLKIGYGAGILGIFFYLLYVYFISALGFFAYGVADLGSGQVGGGAGGVGLGLLMLVFIFIFIFAALFTFFKLVILLFKTFATILILTIIAPIQLTLGVVIPGLGFSNWLKNFVKNLAVFPALGLLLLLALIFASSAAITFIDLGVPEIGIPELEILSFNPASYNQFEGQGWPPFLDLNGAALNFAFVIVSVVILTMAAKVDQLINALMTGRAFGYGTALSEFTGIAPPETGQAGWANKNVLPKIPVVKRFMRTKEYKEGFGGS